MSRDSIKKIVFFILTIFILIFGFNLIKERLPKKIVDIIAPPKIKVMTYAVDYGVGTDGVYSLARIAKIIRDESPHLVFLSGIDYKTKRGFNDEQARKLAADLGMEFTYARNCVRDGGWTGNAILSKYPIDFAENKIFKEDYREETKSLLHVIITLDGQELHFFGTELSTDSISSANQGRELLEFMKDWGRDKAVILVGNFNLQPSAKRMHEIGFYYLDVGAYAQTPILTYPSGAPSKRLDYVFCNKFLTPTTIYVVQNELSQAAASHLPVVAQFKFSD